MQDTTRTLLGPVLASLDQAFGDSYSLVAYGSAARDEFREGSSDLNLLLVTDRLDPARLRSAGASLSQLGKLGHPPPLLLERGEWQRASDVFPIEIVDMQAAHEVLRGADPLAGLQVEPDDLRRALEQEFRGKLLRLRQAYALHAADAGALGTVVAMSVSSIAALLRVVGLLAGIPAPRETPAMLRAVGPVIGADLTVVTAFWEARRRGTSDCPADRFEHYLAAMAAAIRFVDQFTGGTR